MAGGSQGSTFTPTETTLSPELQPYVNKALSEAQRLYETGGPAYYGGETYVKPSAQTLAGLSLAEQRATAGNPLLGQAQGTVADLMKSQSPYEAGYAGMAQNAYTDPNKSFYERLRGGAMQNEALAGTRATSQGAYLGGSPYLEGALGQANRLASESLQEGIRGLQSKTSMAGRYGSGAEQQLAGKMGDVAARALAEQNQQAYLQNYQQERGLQEQALRSLGGLSQQGLANQLTGAQGLGASAQQAFANQMAALGGAQGVRGQDIATRMAAAQAAPGLAAADYADIDRLIAAGQMGEGYTAAQQAADKARYDYTAQLPYQTLQNFGAFITGLPRGGITKEYVAPKTGATGTTGNTGNVGTGGQYGGDWTSWIK